MLRLRLASLYVRAGKLEQALEQCQVAVNAEPENADGLALLAGILSSLGRFNPTKPHRHRRTLRRHLQLLDFLLHATASHRAWAPGH